MFGASYALLEATTLHADFVTLPAPAHIALAMLLIYLGLHHRTGFPWAVFALGLILAWDPLFGASASAGFLVAVGCQEGRQMRPRVLAALLAGIGVSAAALAIVRSALVPLPMLSAAAIMQEEQAIAPNLPLFLFGVFLTALALLKPAGLRPRSSRRLFIFTSLIAAVASALVATARLDSGALLQVYWILLPTVVFAFYGLVRAIARAVRAAPVLIGNALSNGVSVLIFVFLFDILFPIQRLNQIVSRYMIGYEFERHRWYKNCASGKACDRDRKPTLALYLREAARPLAQSAGAKRGPA